MFANGAVTAAFARAFGEAAASGRGGASSMECDRAGCYDVAAMQGAMDASLQVSFDLPTLPPWLVEFSSGVGDGLTFGATRYARGALDVGSISTDSTSYQVGNYGTMAVGGARLLYAVGARGVSMAGSAIGGMEGAAAAHGGRNMLKILARGGFFPNYRIHPFSVVSAHYGGDAGAIISAAGRTNAAWNRAGVAAGGGAAANQIGLCTQPSGC